MCTSIKLKFSLILTICLSVPIQYPSLPKSLDNVDVYSSNFVILPGIFLRISSLDTFLFQILTAQSSGSDPRDCVLCPRQGDKIVMFNVGKRW